MIKKKTDLAIVNRGFWPQSQVIGEALLQLAEKVAERGSVCVITQATDDLPSQLNKQNRGQGVQIRSCKAYTTSASNLLMRIAEAVFFMLWTFISLVRARPANVYVSTNPPVVVPFIVALYCRLFNAEYVYHLQDIHPEATDIVVPLNRLALKLLQGLDNYTLRHAQSVITLSEDMKAYIEDRSSTNRPIYLLDNPSFEVNVATVQERTKDIVFCGNAGRLQRIPLLLAAIQDYVRKGGKQHFTFAGGGMYALDIKALADTCEQVDYLGVIPATDAAKLVNQHRWALLPIDDEITRYAFPSKSSAYALSGAGVLAVCGANTSVARWVEQHNIGIVCEPELDTLVRCFFALEKKSGKCFLAGDEIRKRLQINYFVAQLSTFVFDDSMTTG